MEIERDVYITMDCDPEEYPGADDGKSRKSGKTSYKFGEMDDGSHSSPENFRMKARLRMSASKRIMTPQALQIEGAKGITPGKTMLIAHTPEQEAIASDRDYVDPNSKQY